MINTYQPVSKIMTSDPIYASPLTVMDKVSLIFDKRNIHHVPVLDEENICVGIISMSDFLQIQDKFSRFNLEDSLKASKKFMGSLTAREVMTKNPVSIDLNEPITKAIKLFLKNVYRAIIVTDNGEMVGILTPYDILKEISIQEKTTV